MRSVVALFDRFEDAQQAVRNLRDSGYEQTAINMIARDASGEYSRSLGDMERSETGEQAGSGAAAGAGVGAVLGGLGGLLVGLGALAIPGIGPVIAAGPIITTLAGAGVGAAAGGIIGALVDLGIPDEHAQYYAEGVRRGGTLVVVHTADDRAESARQILNRFHPVDLETRVATWQAGQWTGFSESGEPMSAEQMEFNRSGQSMPVTGKDIGEKVYGEQDTGDVPVTGKDIGEKVYGEQDTGDVPVTGKDIGEKVYGEQDTGDVPVTGKEMGEKVYGEHDTGDVVEDDWQSPNRDMGTAGTGGDSTTPRDMDDRDMGTSQSGSSSDWVSSTGSGPISSGAPTIPVTGAEQDFDKNRRDDNLSGEFSSMDEHLNEDIYNSERAHEKWYIPVTGGMMDVEEIEEIDVFPVDNQDWMRYDENFRSDYLRRFGNMGYGYDYYQPAYRYGYYLARSPQYMAGDWMELEPQARRDWQRSGIAGAWEEVKDAVRHAWEHVKGA